MVNTQQNTINSQIKQEYLLSKEKWHSVFEKTVKELSDEKLRIEYLYLKNNKTNLIPLSEIEEKIEIIENEMKNRKSNYFKTKVFAILYA